MNNINQNVNLQHQHPCTTLHSVISQKTTFTVKAIQKCAYYIFYSPQPSVMDHTPLSTKTTIQFFI